MKVEETHPSTPNKSHSAGAMTMTLRKDNKTGIPGLPYDVRRGRWNVRVGNSSYGYYEDKELALAVRKLIVEWPDRALRADWHIVTQENETNND